MFFERIFFLVLASFVCFAVIGCGEDTVTLGAEEEPKEWADPVDIGKEYPPNSDGPPVVGFFQSSYDDREWVTKKNNRQGFDSGPAVRVGIERSLDYNLLIYLEYQALRTPASSLESGNALERGRVLVMISKGVLSTSFMFLDEQLEGEYDKISYEILPYEGMKDIDLPAEIANYWGMAVPKGHEYRPYRIRSSSYFIEENADEGDW